MKKQPKLKLAPTNVPGLVKDTSTNVILNTNLGGYKRVVALRKKQNEEKNYKEEFKTLQNEVQELKDLVKELLIMFSTKDNV